MSTTPDPYKYEQKKINHVFHYTPSFPNLQGIIRDGFIPSYCKEEIANRKYLTPMVSFCNIPIGEVDKYMRYGKNGIGMSIEWAIKNGLSPVTYTHENSPYQNILGNLSILKLHHDLNQHFNRGPINVFQDELNKLPFGVDQKTLTDKASLTLFQFLKNWETLHKGEKIITYQEREWRYVPNEKNINPLIQETDSEFELFLDKKKKPKPHLPKSALEIEDISEIRYLVVTTEKQVENVLKTLNKKFTEEVTTDALLKGKLSILTASQIRNDF